MIPVCEFVIQRREVLCERPEHDFSLLELVFAVLTLVFAAEDHVFSGRKHVFAPPEV